MRVDGSGIRRIARDPVGGLDNRPRQSGCHRQLAAGQATANGEDATGPIRVFAVKIGRDLVELAFLEPDIRKRVDVGERLHLAFLDSQCQQVARILPPVDLLGRIDPVLGKDD